MTRSLGWIAVFVVLIAAQSASADACRKLYRLSDFDMAIEPGVRVPASESTPAHCRVNGVVGRAIRFQVTLPEDWSGRMMFSGVGGSAGTIGDTTSLLGRGFAMASTDTGHEAADNATFMNQPEALLDYAYRGVHLATVAAKRVIRRYYDNDIDYAYFQGCSNGGRAAMMEAVRFPDDYDGIIAGAPAFRFLEMTPWMMGAGRAHAEHPLTQDSLLLLDNASREACDALDGVEDGVINDPRECTKEHFDVTRLQCRVGQTEGCLTAGQIKTAQYVYEDVEDGQGNVVSPGVFPGGEAGGDWAFWALPANMPAELAGGADFGTTSIVAGVGQMITTLKRFDSSFDISDFDPATDRALIDDVTSPLDVRSADLSEFAARGGKLLMYQGWNDFPLRAGRALDYHARAQEENGGARKTSRFFRLFMVPGMLHCAGGPGAWQADYVDPIVAWREDGKAPERIVAAQPGPTQMFHLSPHPALAPAEEFTRPLCAYPKLARYNGRGDETDAANYRCR